MGIWPVAQLNNMCKQQGDQILKQTKLDSYKQKERDSFVF